MKNKLLWQLTMLTKLTIYGVFLQCLFVGMLMASGSNAQEIKTVHEVYVKLDGAKVPIQKIFREIEASTDFHFSYYPQDFNPKQEISLTRKRQLVSDVLLQISKEMHLSFRQINNNINVRKKENSNSSESIEVVIQGITVTGKVTSSEDNEGLPGVNVVVKGTSHGTVTDVEGNYKLDVADANAVLVFSSVGFSSQEMAVGSRQIIDVSLKPDVTALNEIVVVGYGTQKKSDLTGSISIVNSKTLENRPITNSTQALQGVKGVYVSQAGAQPGRDNALIRIRGQGTLNDNNPLVLVDGVEYPLGDVDPSNIESISVLKDAAASSIYGSRAANGVILVTTKSGKGVQGFHIDYSDYFGVQQAIGLPDFIKDPVQYMELRDQAQLNAGRSTVDFGQDLINEYKQGEKTDPYVYPQNDWFDIMFKPAFIQNHNLRISGGSDEYNYSLALGYQGQDGVLMGTNSNKYSIDLNTNVNVTDRLTIRAIINGQFREFNESVGGTRYLMEMTYKNAGLGYEPTYLEDGRYADTFIRTPGHYVFRNPLALANEGINNHKQQHYRLILNGQYDFPLNITYKIMGSYTKEDYLHKIFEPEVYQYDVKTLEKKRTYITGSPKRRVDKTNEFNGNLSLQQTLEWGQKIRNHHQVSALLGFSMQSFGTNTFNAHNEGYLGNGLTTLNAGSINPSVSGTNGMSTLVSLFGRVNYNYDEKYLLEGNFRYDGSSKFANGNKWGLFPSVSLGWRMDQEAFMKDIVWVDALKLRASWGELGNERVPSYRYLNLIDLGHDYSFGSTIYPGAAVTQYNDPSITWESTTTTNLGLDASFFKSKLDFSLEVFQRRTYNILHAVSIPSQVGDTLEAQLKTLALWTTRVLN